MSAEDDITAPGRSTGPRTPAGKAVSSMNRLTHGCRSEQTILRHEDPAEYTALIQGWLNQYNPQNPAERQLVDQTAHAQRILMRNQRRFDEVEYEKNMHFRHWTEDQNHEYALALRYKVSAERAFLRWFKELESYYARVQRKQRQEANGRPFSGAAPCPSCAALAKAQSRPPAPPLPEQSASPPSFQMFGPTPSLIEDDSITSNSS